MNEQNALLPIRHPQRELFLCDVTDAVLKDDMASMEHPFFALTTQKDTMVRRYENGNKWVEVIPSVKGLATIFDKDILIFATSQLMAAKQEGREVGQELIMSARDVLIFSNRHTGGHNYERTPPVRAALPYRQEADIPEWALCAQELFRGYVWRQTFASLCDRGRDEASVVA